MRNPIRISRAVVRRSRAGFRAFSENFFGTDYSRLSYSQYGEDMVLQSVFTRFPSTYKGFYVDIGAHHPKRFSNTFCFYSKGWRGICIDPIPGGAELFAKQRPRDIFLEIGVSENEGELPFYVFKEPALSTFSAEIFKNYPQQPIEIKKIKTLPLSEILAKHLPKDCSIDLFTVDAEGFDMKVLRSNNWQRFRPRAVVIEEMSVCSLNDVPELEVDRFMNQNGYLAISRIPSGLIYIDTNSSGYDGGAFLNL